MADDQIPVAFAPPQIPVAEAGLLIDAVANTRETAATLIDLAVRGGIRIDNTGTEQNAVLMNPAVANAPHEQALIGAPLPGTAAGEAVPLERRETGDTSMRKAHDAMIDAVRQQVVAQGFYTRMPSRLRGAGLPKRGVTYAFVGIAAIWIFGGALVEHRAGPPRSGSGSSRALRPASGPRRW